MNDQSLIKIDRTDFAVSFEVDALTLRSDALEASALICKVTDAATQEAAVEAQKKVVAVVRAVEKARKVVKEPFLEAGRKIDATAGSFVAELEAEASRIATLVADFQEKERLRIAAEAQLQSAALSRLEREKNERIACAASIEEVDKVREEFSEKERLATVPTAPPIPKAQGQIAKPDFEITVTDIHALYRAYPTCVKLTPLLSEIKALVATGTVPRGVTAKAIMRATVRTPTPKPAVDV